MDELFVGVKGRTSAPGLFWSELVDRRALDCHRGGPIKCPRSTLDDPLLLLLFLLLRNVDEGACSPAIALCFWYAAAFVRSISSPP